MTMQYGSTQAILRRLSTPSYIQAPGKELATKWTWYWKDDNGWKEYAGKKVSSFSMNSNIMLISIQTNIKRTSLNW